jgi:hypothetical protein
VLKRHLIGRTAPDRPIEDGGGALQRCGGVLSDEALSAAADYQATPSCSAVP